MNFQLESLNRLVSLKNALNYDVTSFMFKLSDVRVIETSYVLLIQLPFDLQETPTLVTLMVTTN